MSEPKRLVPDLEDVAAYVDGRLSPERRAWVEEHLVRDEELYEIFQATVAFQEEHRREVGKPSPGWSRTWLLLPLAAAALLVLTLAPGLLRDRAPSERWAERIEPAAIAALGEEWSDPGWNRNRSGGEDCPAAENLPFRMGAWSLDLRLALLAGDDEEALRLAARLKILAGCGDLLPSESEYTKLAESWETLRPVDRRELARTVEEGIADFFSDEPRDLRLFRLGAWAEAGRLAARTSNPEALVSIIRDDPGAAEIPEIASQLSTLTALARRSQLGSQDLTAGTEAFTAVCRILAR